MTVESRGAADGESGVGGAVGWSGVEAAVPELARRVRERFGAYRHHVLATVRKDGAPRLTGLEADFRYGELWLGMMTGSLKVADLRRDPGSRCMRIRGRARIWPAGTYGCPGGRWR